MLNRSHRDKGFTLIELMITITLVAILTSLAIPAINDWIRRAAVRSLAETYQNGLRTAQGEAIKRNRNMQFALVTATPSAANAISAVPNVNGPHWLIREVNAAGTAVAGSFVSAEQAAAVGGTARVTGSAASVVFTGFGRARSAAMTDLAAPVVFRIDDAQIAIARCVYVTPGGAVRICDPSQTNAVTGCPAELTTATACPAP